MLSTRLLLAGCQITACGAEPRNGRTGSASPERRSDPHHGMGTPQVMEQVEHQVKAGLDLLVGIEDDRAAGLLHQAGGQRLAQLPARRLLAFTLVEANL